MELHLAPTSMFQRNHIATHRIIHHEKHKLKVVAKTIKFSVESSLLSCKAQHPLNEDQATFLTR